MKKSRFLFLIFIIISFLFTCGGGGGSNADSGRGNVSVDSQGIIQSAIIINGPEGLTYTLPAGTRIIFQGNSDSEAGPTSENIVTLSLAIGSGTSPGLPAGIGEFQRFRIILSVDGNERDACFFPSSNETGKAPKLTVVVSNLTIAPGTLGMLFDISDGTPVMIGSSLLKETGEKSQKAMKIGQKNAYAQAFGIRDILNYGNDITRAAESGSNASEMAFSPNKTGNYSAAGSAPGAAEEGPAGAFWCTYTIPDPGPVTTGGIVIEGPCKVERAYIVEESTAEILADFFFNNNDTASSGSRTDGARFWAKRTLNSDGSSTIRVSSMQANLPVLCAHLVRISDGLPMWDNYYKPDGGLHGPGGDYSDPYTHKEFEFAGFKQFIVTTNENKNYKFYKEHACMPLQNKYTANPFNYNKKEPGFIGYVYVHDTLDARVLIQEILIKEKWKVINEKTKGNSGTYEYKEASKYTGTISIDVEDTLANCTHTFNNHASFDITLEKDPSFPSGDGIKWKNTESVSITGSIDETTSDCAGALESLTSNGNQTITMSSSNFPVSLILWNSEKYNKYELVISTVMFFNCTSNLGPFTGMISACDVHVSPLPEDLSVISGEKTITGPVYGEHKKVKWNLTEEE